MNINRLVPGLVLLNLGVFVAIAAFLPQTGSYTYSTAIARFFNARTDWDIAFAGTLGSTLISIGFVLLLNSHTPPNPR